MSDPKGPPKQIDKVSFKVARKGYDKNEVKEYLAELEQAFGDMERWALQTKERLAQVEGELHKARANEEKSVDNAMYAVFDAKDRIIERARSKARRIEEDATQRAEDAERRAMDTIQAAEREAEAIRSSADGGDGASTEAARQRIDEAIANCGSVVVRSAV